MAETDRVSGGTKYVLQEFETMNVMSQDEKE